MEQILINLIAGALGGVGAGKASPTFDLGTAGNIISGLVGGGVLGQIATLALPAVVAAAQSGNLSISGIVSQAIAGGAGGRDQEARLVAIDGHVHLRTGDLQVAREVLNARHVGEPLHQRASGGVQLLRIC